jgi:hypothetical protein
MILWKIKTPEPSELQSVFSIEKDVRVVDITLTDTRLLVGVKIYFLRDRRELYIESFRVFLSEDVRRGGCSSEAHPFALASSETQGRKFVFL